MPQITLEYTSNIKQKIDTKFLFQETHKILNETADIAIQNCKSRAIMQSDFFIGNGNSKNAFVHLDIAILEGRSNDLIHKLGNELLKLFENYFAQTSDSNDLQVTVEIRDIYRKNYFKIPALR